VAFLLWLLYCPSSAAAFARQMDLLPQLNALLNGLSAVALSVGFYFIKHKQRAPTKSACSRRLASHQPS